METEIIFSFFVYFIVIKKLGKEEAETDSNIQSVIMKKGYRKRIIFFIEMMKG